MRDLDALDGAEKFTAAQIEDQNLMSALGRSEEPAAAKVDAEVIELALDRRRHIEFPNLLERRG
jgi:hypothetical protein